MNILRVSSLLATDILLVAMLAFLLAGCVTTPQQQQYRNGDFTSNMASADVNAPATSHPATSSVRKA